MWTAYALWYFAGWLGAHNFYLGKPVPGALQIAALPFLLCMLLIAEWIGMETTVARALGFIGYGAVCLMAISLLIDLFLIPARIRAHSERVRTQLEAEADWQAA